MFLVCRRAAMPSMQEQDVAVGAFVRMLVDAPPLALGHHAAGLRVVTEHAVNADSSAMGLDPAATAAAAGTFIVAQHPGTADIPPGCQAGGGVVPGDGRSRAVPGDVATGSADPEEQQVPEYLSPAETIAQLGVLSGRIRMLLAGSPSTSVC